MQLIYHKNEVLNFGDDLNAILWREIAPKLFDNPDDGNGFLGIGTIVGKDVAQVKRLHIFSSGAGYDRVEFKGCEVEVHCVRGPLTARLMGQTPDKFLTDGAILTPLIIEAGAKTGKTLVIPHWQSLYGYEPAWEEACDRAGMELCSPMQDVKTVVTAISGAERVLTESLHGAILADTYGVPWAAWVCSGNFSDFKWMDWLSSMGMRYDVTRIEPASALVNLKLGRKDHQTHQQLEEAYADLSVFASEAGGGALAAQSNAKQMIKGAFYKSGLSNVVLGGGPKGAASDLRQLLRTANFQLSEVSIRDRLRAEMLKRLHALENSL